MSETELKVHRFTQNGTFSVIIMAPLLVFSLVMIIISLKSDLSEVLIFSFLALTFLVCLLIFYKLTIIIDSESVSFRLGNGMIKKRYPLKEIKSCKAVKNPVAAGIGIRMISNGWLYNVSGLQAIELSFKNRKSVVRIGTDQPDKISDLINNLINNEEYPTVSTGKEMTGQYISLAIVILSLFLPAILLISGGKEQTVTATVNDLTISGIYGVNIKYTDIKALDTVNHLPAVKRRTNGYAAGSTLKGYFTLSNGMKVKLFIKKANPPYIYIRSTDKPIYLNFRDRNKTLELFKELKLKTGQI